MRSTLQTVFAGALGLCTIAGAYIGSRRPSIKSSEIGVAFDLTASYGSAAVSFPNGTTITVADIPASQDYNEVLQRLSLASSQHLSPPYNNLGDSWDDMPRQYMRKARKAIGLPASKDVGHLAKMIADLRDAVQEKIGEEIKVAAVTTMHLLALYDEDLHDAFQYLGLEYITFPIGDVGHNILYQTSAAFAGYGYGLCDDYMTDAEDCRVQQWNMDVKTVMAVVYTDTALSVSLSMLRSPYSLWEPRYRYLADFDLGHQEIDKLTSTKEEVEQYWASVKLRLGQMLIENPYYDRPSIVMLMGDRTEDTSFRQVLNSVLDEHLHEPPTVLSDGAKGVAARGAAEMAKRQPFLAIKVRRPCAETMLIDVRSAFMNQDALRVQQRI